RRDQPAVDPEDDKAPKQCDRQGQQGVRAQRASQREPHRHRGQAARDEQRPAEALELNPFRGALLKNFHTSAGKGYQECLHASSSVCSSNSMPSVALKAGGLTVVLRETNLNKSYNPEHLVE